MSAQSSAPPSSAPSSPSLGGAGRGDGSGGSREARGEQPICDEHKISHSRLHQMLQNKDIGTADDLASIMSTGSMRKACPPTTNQLSPAITKKRMEAQVELHAGNPVATSFICFVPSDTTPSSIVPYFLNNPFTAACSRNVDRRLYEDESNRWITYRFLTATICLRLIKNSVTKNKNLFRYSCNQEQNASQTFQCVHWCLQE